jgi:hypothetical protein
MNVFYCAKYEYFENINVKDVKCYFIYLYYNE